MGDVREVDPARVRRPVHEHLRRRRGRRHVEQPDDRQHRHRAARRAARRPAGRARSARPPRASPGRRSRGTSAGPAPAPTPRRGPRAGPTPSTQICTSRSAIAAQSFASYSGSSRSNAPRSSGVLVHLGARDAAADPDEARDAVRVLERRVERDRPAARAADEHRPLDPGRVHHGDHVRAVGERHRLGRRSGRSRACRSAPSRWLADERAPLRVPLRASAIPAWVSTTPEPSPAHCAHRRAARHGDVPSNASLGHVRHATGSRSRCTAAASGRRQWVIDIAST